MNELHVKAAIRVRDGMRCVRCGMTNEEHVATYGRYLDIHRVVAGSEYSLEPGVCQTVCIECHGPLPRRRPARLNGKVRLVIKTTREVKLALLSVVRNRNLANPAGPRVTIHDVFEEVVRTRFAEELEYLWCRRAAADALR